MSGLKKFLTGKKKSLGAGGGGGKKGQKKSLHSSTGSLSSLSKNGSNANLAVSTENLGGYILKEKDLSKFLKAAWIGDLSKLKQVTSKKVNWNETDKEHRSALHLASAKGHEDIVEFIVSHGANVNLTDSEGKTPLMKACENNSVTNVDCLLRNGAETNVFDVNLVSAMHIAAAQGNVDIGYQLADQDAKLDAIDKNQITPLHLCCGLGNASFVEFLVSENIDVNCVDNQKRTPLMAACIDGHIDIVQLLLENDAGVGMIDKDGHTAEELASINDNAPIAALLDEHSRKNQTLISPAGSIHSKKSAHELFSPAVQSLKEMFSPGRSSQMRSGSIFGGPAINTGGNADLDKSEESRSEELGDNSWGDSDMDSEVEKKPKGINISAMLKKKEEQRKEVQSSSPVAELPSTKTNNPSNIPKLSGSTALAPTRVLSPKTTTDQTPSKIPRRADSNANDKLTKRPGSAVKNVSDVEDETDFSTDKGVLKKPSTKLPWQQNDELDESESEWGDDGLEDQFAAGIGDSAPKHVTTLNSRKNDKDFRSKTEVVPSSHPMKSNIDVPPVFAVPPPPDIEFSGASSDFDSSQPEESFSDLPLSDMDGSNTRDKKAADAAAKLFVAKKASKDTSKIENDDNTESKWDSTDEDEEEPGMMHASKQINKGMSKDHDVKEDDKQVPQKMKLSMEPANNESDSDSDSPIPSGPSEEVLHPRTPDQGSEFEPSSTDDEESDFNLEEITNKNIPRPGEPEETSKSIFQTEVVTPRQDEPDESSDDQIEQQMLGLSDRQMTVVAKKVVNKPKIPDARKKQLADLGLDLGSSVSSVSDPEGFSERKEDLLQGKMQGGEKADDENNNHLAQGDNKSKKKSYDAMGIILSDDSPVETETETETESEWEKDQRKKRNEHNANENDMQRGENAKARGKKQERLLNEINSENKKDKEKEQQRLEEYEVKRKAHEDRLAAEIAEELRNEMMDDKADIEFDSSSDFSFSQDGADLIPGNSQNENVLQDKIASESEDEAVAVAQLLKQMGKKENEYHKENEKKQDLLKQKEKDEGIKSKLQDILERAKSPQSHSKAAELLTENQESLRKLQQDIDKREMEVLKKESESMDRLKEVESKTLKLKEKEKERLQKALEDEERMNKIKLEQETLKEQEKKLMEAKAKKDLIEQEVQRRKAELLREEETRLKKLEEEERVRKEKLANEEEERLKAILENEKRAREEHEKEGKIRMEKLKRDEDEKRLALEKEAEEVRQTLAKQEQETKLALEKEEERHRKALQKEEQEKKLALQKEEEERKVALEREVVEKRKALETEEKKMKKRLEDEEHKRLRALSDEERNRRKIFEEEEELMKIELAKKEELLKLELTKKEGDLKKIQDEENKRKEILIEHEAKIKKLEIEAENRKKQLQNESEEVQQEGQRRIGELEKQAIEREKERLEEIERLVKERELKRIEEIEMMAQKKEKEMNERLQRIEEKKMKQWKEEEVKFMKRLKEKEKLNDSFELLREEENRLKDCLQNEEIEKREKLKKQLDEEERDRKRQLSAEGKKFRAELERERDAKLKELANKNEEERQKSQQEFEKKQLVKLEKFELESQEREQQLVKKLQQIEDERIRELERQTKIKETELNEKLRKMEEEKQREWVGKEEDLIRRMRGEAARREGEEARTEAKTNDEDYRKRFHELEKESRIREMELEMQLVNLRQKQSKITSGSSAKNQVLSPVPVDEIVVAVKQATEETIAMNDFQVILADVENDLLNTSPQLNDEVVATIDNTPSASDVIRRLDEHMVTDIEKGGLNPFLSELKQSDVIYEAYLDNPMKYLKGASTPFSLNGRFHPDDTILEELREDLLEARRQIDLYREKTSAQDRIKREMEYDMEEMHRTIELLSQSQNDNEKTCLGADLELRSIKYKHEQEIEAKAVAERLCNQLKDQLGRSEKKLTREADSRQTVELANRKLQSQLKLRDQEIHKLESEMHELHLTIETERDSRTLQESLYQEQLRQHELILQEAQKSSHDHAQAVSKLEALDENRRQAENTTDTLKMELAKAKGVLSRALSQLDENRSQTESEVNRLRDKLQEKTEELNSVEKHLFQVQLQLESEKLNKQSHEERITSSLENELNTRKRLEEEILYLKTCLENSNREIDRLADETFSSDKDALLQKEKFNTEKNYLEKELAVAKEQLKVAEEKLSKVEIQIATMTSELRNTGMALAEQKGEAVVAQKDVEQTKSSIQQLEDNLRCEKINSSKLESKLETTYEKINLLQNECEKLDKELESAKEQYILRDRAANKKQESVNSYVMTIKDDFQKDFNDTKNNLSKVEIEKTAYVKEREEVLLQNSELKETISKLQEQIQHLSEDKFEIEQQAHEVKSDLDKSKHIASETTQRLVKKSTDIEKMRHANLELRDNLQSMKTQNISIETDLREEKAKAEILLQELRDANEARESLETLLSNVKGSNVTLEEKLHSESLFRSQREREAEEHKGLWESEVKSRSKLGLKVMELEKQIQEMKNQVEEEKRKTRRALDLKKGADSKIELYEQRSVQHQKEVSALRSKLKQYQRRFKEYESGESRIPALHAEFDREREAMSSNVNKLRHQLDQLSDQLRHEQERRTSTEKTNREQMKEVTDLKTKEKVQAYEQDKLEKKCRTLEHELSKQKEYYDRHYIPREEIEEFKNAMETKARLDLNKKLQEVNMHLEEQALAREAFEKIRNDKENKSRKEFEHTITDLKNELGDVRTTLHSGLAKRDTSRVESKRFKELFESERSAKDRLLEKLATTNKRLNMERSRTNYLFDETINKSKVTKRLFDASLEKDGQYPSSPQSTRLAEDFDYNANSYRPKLWSTPATSSPHKSPERDYLSLLKRRDVFS